MRQADGSTLRTAYDADGNAITQTDALARRTVWLRRHEPGHHHDRSAHAHHRLHI
jgi:YD repeat-containing protein